jgi:Fe2+ transport system protein B
MGFWIAGMLFCIWGMIAHMKLYKDEIRNWGKTKDTIWNGVTGVMNFVTTIVYLVFCIICLYQSGLMTFIV